MGKQRHGLGGAVAVDDGIVTIENSVFVGNVAPDAASIHASDSTLLLSHLTVFDDFSSEYDGALVVVENVRGLWSNLILSAAAPTGIVVRDEVSVVGLEGVLFERLETAYDAYFRCLRVSGDLVGLDPRLFDASSDGDRPTMTCIFKPTHRQWMQEPRGGTRTARRRISAPMAGRWAPGNCAARVTSRNERLNQGVSQADSTGTASPQPSVQVVSHSLSSSVSQSRSPHTG